MNDATIIENPQTMQFVQDCLHYSTQWGQTTYYDLCSGGSYIVPHGFWDYFLGLAIGGIAVITLLLLVRIILDF